LSVVCLFGTCQENDTLSYIFLGHIKLKQNGQDKVDPRIEGIDFSDFDRIWLGGDVTDESNLNYETLNYIDSLFDVSKPSNIWVYGNHDLRNFNEDWLREITGKKTYYAYSENGITTIALNLAINPSDCEKLNDQFEMIKNVCDTIQESSHLIVICHNSVWKDVPGLLPPYVYSQSNLKYWLANCYDKPADFTSIIYPLLLEVKSRGITVLNILGDSGSFNKGVTMLSSDGIFFIASGISSSTQEEYGPDKVLIIKHHPESEFLNWQFHNLDSLYQSYQ
jgi:hypothetical protein